MHTQGPGPWHHEHAFHAGNAAGERGTRRVMWITAATMVAEIAAGWAFNSMALLADGFHMSSHAFAIGLSALAYAAARRHAADPRYAFGTWKIEVLGGFASAVFLLFVVGLMLYGSIERLVSPQPIGYPQAIAVAVVGLAVNVVSAFILGAAHDHGHDHGHDPEDGRGRPAAAGGRSAATQPAHAGHDHPHHPHHRHHHDLNLRSAYLHVIADATTSLLALVALAGGWWLGWAWLDPAMGIVGAMVVAVWARNLIADTSKVLLDREMDHPVVERIRQAVEQGGAGSAARVADLHVWRVGRGAYACALTVVSHDAELRPDRVKQWLARHAEVVHSTVELHVNPRA